MHTSHDRQRQADPRPGVASARPGRNPALWAVAVLFLLGLLAPSAAGLAPRQSPIRLPTEPSALIYGHAATVYLQILAAGQLDTDGAADLVIGELVTGRHSDEPMESALLPGRPNWPRRSGTEGLGVRKIAEPTYTTDDQFTYVGAVDLNNDRRDDLVTALVQTRGARITAVNLAVHFSPASLPARPDMRQGDIALPVPSKTVPQAILAADVNCDGLNDLIINADQHVGILFGRQPWPAQLPLEPPDTRIEPPASVVQAADVSADGCADLWLSLDGGAADAALILGQATWPAEMDAVASADVTIGEGHLRLGGAIVPDITGDGLADALRVDHVAGQLEVFAGGPDLPSRLANAAADWSVMGISDTWRVECLDLTADGVAELLLDRHAILAGGLPRHGSLDLAGGDYDAEWPALGDLPIWVLDVDGRNGTDVVINDSSGSVTGRKGAGTIQIFLAPLFTVPTPQPPSPSATPGSHTPVPTPTSPATASPIRATPSPAEPTATPAAPQPRLCLPVAWTGAASARTGLARR